MPSSPYDINKRRKSTSADIERAQKFRERAKTVTVGTPDFRVSKKYEGKDIYKTLGSHPDLLELTGATVGGPRRVSDDRTSNCNSAPDEFFDALDQIESGRNSSGPASTNNSARNSMVTTATANNNLYENICNNLGPKFEKLVTSGKSVEGIAYQLKSSPSTANSSPDETTITNTNPSTSEV